MKVISFVIQKGGTGKSTCSTCTLGALFKRNKKVLLIDADPQGNATTCMGIKQIKYSLYDCLSKNVSFQEAVIKTPYGDVLAGNVFLADLEEELFLKKFGKEKVLKKYIENEIQNEGYDYIIIDTPPHFGNIVINVLMATDKIIAPIIPSELSIEGITQFIELFEAIKEENTKLEILGVLFNMTNPRTKEYKRLHAQLKEIFAEKLLNFIIPLDQRIIESQNFQNFKDNMAKPCVIAFPNSKASLAFEELADLIVKEKK